MKATEKHSKHEENLAFSTKCFEVVLRVVVGAYTSKTWINPCALEPRRRFVAGPIANFELKEQFTNLR